jgi:hypothetical protein
MENIILAAEEDITDITDFSDSEQVKVQIINLELKQKCWLDGEKREFMIFNGKQCYQKVENRQGGKKKFRINLSYLDAIPERQVSYAYNWLIGAMLMLSVAIVCVYLLVSGYPVDRFTAISLIGTGVFIGIPAFAIGAMKSTCRVTFFSRFGRAPVLELINASPNSKTYMTFIDFLQQKINSYNRPKDGGMRSYLLNELAELRRLKNEAVLSSTQFNDAMQKIISNSAYKL